MDPERRLAELGLVLPSVPAPVANYVPYSKFGKLLFLSGTVGSYNGEVRIKGRLGDNLTVEEGYESARLCALNHLAVIKQALGSLDRVAKIHRLIGYVVSAPGFQDQPAVLNGASDLLVAVFGEERGRHARAAIGVSELSLEAPVETELIVESF